MTNTKLNFTKQDVDFFLQIMREEFVTKNDLHEVQDTILTRLDGIAKQIADLDDEFALSRERMESLAKRTNKIEKFVGLPTPSF